MILTTMVAAALLCADVKPEAKPDGVPVSTWVREDLFAGFLTNDRPRFDQGMAKLDAILAANPRSSEALAWRAGGTLYRAVRSLEAGDRAAFDQQYAAALSELKRAREVASPQEMGANLAITGGVWAVFADRVPADLRRDAWLQVRTNYAALREAQKPIFDRLPMHMRGEVLAGLAQAEQRLGESGTALADLIAALPDTVYAKRAKLWQEKPETAARTSLTCQSCHEPGRLEAVQARAKKP